MISIIVPTIRPQNIPKLQDACALCGVDYEFLWEEDKERIGAPKMVRKLVERAKYDLVCFLGDDTIPEPGFLKSAHDTMVLTGALLVGLNDKHSKKPTHWLASKELLPLIGGEFFCTEYLHNFCDDELRQRADKIGKYVWCEAAKVDHFHPVFGTADWDDDYKKVLNKERWDHDLNLFIERNGKLSVCMIVKNEELMLKDCLETVKDADEIIIVDTGSTDKTKEIAAQYTDKIYDYPWNDDFSAARNVALSYATCDWILSVDADERLEEGGIKRLKKFFATEDDAIGINLWSTNDSLFAPRCFRNKPSIKWVGRIHETIPLTQFSSSGVKLEFKSSPSHQYDPDRNIRMLEKAAQDNPNDSRTLFYLGREYAYRQNWDKSLETLNKYLEISTYREW